MCYMQNTEIFFQFMMSYENSKPLFWQEVCTSKKAGDACGDLAIEKRWTAYSNNRILTLKFKSLIAIL